MKILVTGGAGFIGSHLVRQLMEAGDEVISLDNLSTGLRENLPEGARLEVMDTHDDKVEDLFREEHFDAVVHLAAQTLVSDSMVDPENDMYQNIAGTVHIMECCRKYGVKRVIFSSSAATGLLLDIFKEYGTDSRLGLIASISMACTETIFYTMSVYFMTAKIKKTRYTLTGALLATLAGLAASVLIAGMM